MKLRFPSSLFKHSKGFTDIANLLILAAILIPAVKVAILHEPKNTAPPVSKTVTTQRVAALDQELTVTVSEEQRNAGLYFKCTGPRTYQLTDPEGRVSTPINTCPSDSFCRGGDNDRSIICGNVLCGASCSKTSMELQTGDRTSYSYYCGEGSSCQTGVFGIPSCVKCVKDPTPTPRGGLLGGRIGVYKAEVNVQSNDVDYATVSLGVLNSYDQELNKLYIPYSSEFDKSGYPFYIVNVPYGNDYHIVVNVLDKANKSLATNSTGARDFSESSGTVSLNLSLNNDGSSPTTAPTSAPASQPNSTPTKAVAGTNPPTPTIVPCYAHNQACGGEKTPPTNTCPGNDWDYTGPAGDKWCKDNSKNSQDYCYTCQSLNVEGTPKPTTAAGAGGPPADSLTGGTGDICKNQGGPKAGGYVAPICFKGTPTSSNYRDGLFNPQKAERREYQGATYYDVITCNGKDASGSDLYFRKVDGICNDLPWTGVGPGTPTPTRAPGTPECSGDRPYYNPVSKKCEPRPDACLSATNTCELKTACPNGRASRNAEANIACQLDRDNPDVVCCAKPVGPTPTLQPGTTRAPTPTFTPTPTAQPGEGGGVCGTGGACLGSDNACHPGWRDLSQHCCHHSERWCNTLRSCTTSVDCPASAPTATPTTPPAGGGDGGTGTGTAVQDEHCYHGNSDCAPGYQCSTGDRGTNTSVCRGIPFGSPGSACGPQVGGIGCAKAEAPYTSPGSYCVKKFGAGSTSISSLAAGDACRTGGDNYCCTAPTGGGGGGGGASQPTAVPTSSLPRKAAVPGGYGDGAACPAGTPDGFVDGEYCKGGRQIDVYCEDGVITHRDANLTCVVGLAGSSSSIASQKNTTASVCLKNTDCTKSKQGNACVFYGNSTNGTCKLIQ